MLGSTDARLAIVHRCVHGLQLGKVRFGDSSVGAWEFRLPIGVLTYNHNQYQQQQKNSSQDSADDDGCREGKAVAAALPRRRCCWSCWTVVRYRSSGSLFRDCRLGRRRTGGKAGFAAGGRLRSLGCTRHAGPGSTYSHTPPIKRGRGLRDLLLPSPPVLPHL